MRILFFIARVLLYFVAAVCITLIVFFDQFTSALATVGISVDWLTKSALLFTAMASIALAAILLILRRSKTVKVIGIILLLAAAVCAIVEGTVKFV